MITIPKIKKEIEDSYEYINDPNWKLSEDGKFYEYKNTDITDGLSIGNTHFKAYDKRGKELKQYPQNGLFEPSEIGESGVFTASVAFALNNDNNYLKIEYYNDTASKKPDATFEQTW